MKVAVIGGGMFGAMTAARLAQEGVAVTLFERSWQLLRGASLNNQNRLHLGFHYPRDERTARQCVEGFGRFLAEFPACVNFRFVNAYFIAAEGSLTSPEAYLAFADRVGLRYQPLDTAAFRPRVQGVSMGIAVDEVVYDADMLREAMLRRLVGVNVTLDCDVDGIARRGRAFALTSGELELGEFDAVVNCTYADINRLGKQLGHLQTERQYEYTMVPIVRCDHPPVGITIMDGRFMTLLPFGHTGSFLLYHVDHAVIGRTSAAQMPAEWRSRETSPASNVHKASWFESMRSSCANFVPSLWSAEVVDFLEGPRVVLANNDSTDARPSFIESPEPGYMTVFAGKIDHCLWVADEVAVKIFGEGCRNRAPNYAMMQAQR